MVLSDDERIQLSSLAGSRSLAHALVARAKVILWSAEGASNAEIAARLAEVLGSAAAIEFLDASEDDANLEIVEVSDALYIQAKRFAQKHKLLKVNSDFDFVVRL